MPRRSKSEEPIPEEQATSPEPAIRGNQLVVDRLMRQLNGASGNKAPERVHIGRLGDMISMDIPTFSSGSLSLDLAMGHGGYPRGRIIEIFGPESSGKTTLALHAAAEMQALDRDVAYIDMEHTLSSSYAQKLGVNPSLLAYSVPENGEEAMDDMDGLLSSGQYGLIILDSVASLTTKPEMEAEASAVHMGQVSRLMSQCMRRFTTKCSGPQTTLIFINQIRMKLGVMFGNPETTTGGNALKYYSSIRLDIRRKDPIKDGDLFIGSSVQVKVVKNKLYPPFRTALFNIIYGLGIDKEADVISTAANLGVIERAGAWYRYTPANASEALPLGQGLESAISYLKANQSILQDIRKRTLAMVDQRLQLPTEVSTEDQEPPE